MQIFPKYRGETYTYESVKGVLVNYYKNPKKRGKILFLYLSA